VFKDIRSLKIYEVSLTIQAEQINFEKPTAFNPHDEGLAKP
jgi:hypothetical protein